MTYRYFIMVFIFYIPAVAVLFDKLNIILSSKAKTIFIMFTVITVLANGALRFQQIILTPDGNSNRYGYIQFLRKRNLNFGFSTVFNANITTELTNGEIVIGGINKDTLTTHDEWLTKKEYENPDYYDNEIFVLYSRQEWDVIKQTDRLMLKKPVYEDPDFIVLTYPSTKIVHEQLFF